MTLPSKAGLKVLRLLLDEHVSPAVALEVRRHRPGLTAVALQDYEQGAYRGVPDADVLMAALAQGFTLLSYDQRTIPPLLKSWGEAGISHGGVIFVDRRTLEPADVGGLVRAICQVYDAFHQDDWTDRVLYLSKSDP